MAVSPEVGMEIIVVSGLPRSGTSLMMQMLDRGGIPALTDQLRAADVDNPRGYYEFERVKKIKEDRDWLPEARGKAVKMISALLYDLPATEHYRIVFMQRDLDEVLDSQVRMLERRDRQAAPRDRMRESFELHLERLMAWVATQDNMQLLTVPYQRLITAATEEVARVAEFLGDRPRVADMLAAIDPQLYRNRR